MPRLRGFDEHRTGPSSPFKRNSVASQNERFLTDKDIKVPHSMRNPPKAHPQRIVTETIDDANQVPMPRPAPLITGREGLIDSSKDCAESSPSAVNMKEEIMQRLSKAGSPRDFNSLDSDRKILINCLAHESQTDEKMNSTVLTRLLKGQAPSVISSQRTNVDMLNLEDVTGIKKTELESKVELNLANSIYQNGGKTSPSIKDHSSARESNTLLFFLNTLYST